MNATSATLPSTDGSQPYRAPVSASVEDLRNDERVKTSLAGTISDKGASLACLVRDISEGGAKIEIDATCPLAPNFDLIIAETQTLYRCELRWRYARAVGVKFVSSKPLSDVEEKPTREELLAENAELKEAVARLTQQLADLAVSTAGKGPVTRMAKNPSAQAEAKTTKRAIAPRSMRAAKKPKAPAA